MNPFDSQISRFHFHLISDFLGDRVTEPQVFQTTEQFWIEEQWIPSSESLIRFSEFIDIGGGTETSTMTSGLQHHLAISHSAIEARIQTSFSFHSIFIRIPEEDSYASSAMMGMVGACADLFLADGLLTAVTLGTEHLSTHQTHRRSPGIVHTQ